MFEDNVPDLPYLVRFSMAIIPLKINPLLYTRFEEDMMATANTFSETQIMQQLAQVTETDISI